MSNFKFPKGFYFGTASSSVQSEGAADENLKGLNIWDWWYKLEQNRFFEQVGPKDTSQFYYKYREDIQLMKKFSHNSFRTSIQWSRLLPKARGECNREALKFYSSLIDELNNNKIEPFINLFHFDMPLILQNEGGWESREVINAFVEYARLCFTHFGNKVKHWFTFNEPIVTVEAGYLFDAHYPNVISFQRASQVAYNMILAHSKVVELFREFQSLGKISKDSTIGIILNLSPTYPRSSQLSEDLEAAYYADLLFNRAFLDPILKEGFPKDLKKLLKEKNIEIYSTKEERLLIARANIDLLGVNYYAPRRVKLRENLVSPKAPFMPEHLFDFYNMPGRKMNVYRGWEIYERGIYDISMDLKKNYSNLAFYISENGMGVEREERFRNKDGFIEDDYRIDFIREHLKWLSKALEDGANVKGYHLWTLVDNWSWTNAYKNRYGFVELDLKNNFKRIPKKSLYWFKDLIEKSVM